MHEEEEEGIQRVHEEEEEGIQRVHEEEEEEEGIQRVIVPLKCICINLV